MLSKQLQVNNSNAVSWAACTDLGPSVCMYIELYITPVGQNSQVQLNQLPEILCMLWHSLGVPQRTPSPSGDVGRKTNVSSVLHHCSYGQLYLEIYSLNTGTFTEKPVSFGFNYHTSVNALKLVLISQLWGLYQSSVHTTMLCAWMFSLTVKPPFKS